jgi:hypothetical protein
MTEDPNPQKHASAKKQRSIFDCGEVHSVSNLYMKHKTSKAEGKPCLEVVTLICLIEMFRVAD